METLPETIIDEFNELTDTQRRLAAAIALRIRAETKQIITDSEQRVVLEIRANREWWKELLFQALRWLEGKIK